LHTEASQQKNERKLHFHSRNIDDVLSPYKLCDFVVIASIPLNLKKKDTTDTVRYVPYLDLHLEMDNEGRLGTKLYDK
jgi:hypothetical protein